MNFRWIPKNWKLDARVPVRFYRRREPGKCRDCGVELLTVTERVCSVCWSDRRNTRKREYRQRPDITAKMREYLQAYKQRPDVREKQREYMRRYRQHPQYKELHRAYMREWRKRRKLEVGE